MSPGTGTSSTRARRGPRVLAGVVAGGLALAGCGGSPQPASTTGTPASAGAPQASLRLSIQPARWRLPAPISGEVALRDRGSLLVVGGLDASDRSTAGVLRIDPRTGRAREAGSLAQPAHDQAGAVLPSGRVLIFGGGGTTAQAAVQELVPGGVGRPVGRLPTARSDLDAAVVDGRALAIGGYDGSRALPDVLATTDGRRLAEVARLPVPVRYPAVAATGGAVYVIGGERTDGQDSTAIQRVDVARRTARVVGRLPVRLAHASATVLGGRVYILGGRADGATSDRVWRLDPRTAAVTTAGRLPHPVANAAVADVAGDAYLVGGLGPGGTPLADVTVVRLVPGAR